MTEKSLSFLSPEKLASFILKIHGAVLDAVVYIISLLFVGLMLAVLIPGFPLQYYLSFLLLLFIPLEFFKKGYLSEKIISIYFYILKKISIFAGALIIVLFLNYFFGFSESLSQKFFAIWQMLEKIANRAIFSAMFPVILGLLHIYLTVALLFFANFLINKIKLCDKTKNIIIGVLLVIFVVVIPFAAIYSDYFSNNLESKLYPKIGWIFSVSLIALFGNYLVKELFKIRQTK